MGIVYIVLMLLAFVCFLVSAAQPSPPTPPRWSFLSIGLALWSLAELLKAIPAR
jgi:hypothetical protein